MAIALTAVLAVVTLNYLPIWRAAADDTYYLTRTGLTTLETAYKLHARANQGSTASAWTELTPYIGFTPKAPSGYAWKFSKNTQGAGHYDYFCLYPTTANVTNEGIYRGLAKVKQVFPDAQYVLHADDGTGASCGAADGSFAEPTVFPATVSATFFVQYIPGQ